MLEKIAFIGIFAILLFLSGFALAQETNISEGPVETITLETNTSEDTALINAHSKALEVRIDKVTLGYEKTLAAMETIIEKAAELNTTTEKLLELKNNFTSTYNELGVFVTTVDPFGFGKKVAEMHKIAAKFKNEVHAAIKEEHRKEVREKVKERKEQKENEEEYKKLKERAFKKTREFYKVACSQNSERMEKTLEKASEYNVTINLEKLKSDIEEKCNNIDELENETEFDERVKQVRESFNYAKTNRTKLAREISEKGVLKAIEIISNLKNRGINISGVEEKLRTIKARQNELKAACVELEIDKCKEKLRELRNGLEKTGEKIKEIVKRESEKRRKVREKIVEKANVEEVREKIEERKAVIENLTDEQRKKIREGTREAVREAIEG